MPVRVGERDAMTDFVEERDAAPVGEALGGAYDARTVRLAAPAAGLRMPTSTHTRRCVRPLRVASDREPEQPPVSYAAHASRSSRASCADGQP